MFQSIVISIYFFINLINIVNNELIVRPSESFVLRDQYKPFIALCSGETNTRAVSWQSPLQTIIQENNYERITVERKKSGLRLRIRNLTENDQGTWKCLGIDQYGNSISQNFQINVKTPITFLSASIQYAKLDSPMLIRCQVDGNPSVEISWFKGKTKVEIVFSSNYEQRNEGLKIHRVSSIDNDIFWCQADLVETGESKEFPIEVIIAESISSTKITCLTPCAVEKRTAILICEANGTPKPEYLWSYGQNSPIITNGQSKFVIRDNRLIINQVDQTDNGRYVCHAFSDYDKIGQKADYTLNVIIPPELSPISRKETNIHEDSLSERVSFSCRLVRGSIENLSLQWFYENQTLVQPVNGISINTIQRLSELTFYPVRREHHGNYTCLAKNSADTTTAIAYLFIHYKPVFIGSKTDHIIYSTTNHPVKMKCRFDSSPSPVIQWFKIFEDYNQILLDKQYPQVSNILINQIDSTIYETELIYDPLEEDFDLKFECRADNSQVEKHILTLRRAELPGQVQIQGIEPYSTSIQLIVQPPRETGGLPLLQYIIMYTQMDIPNSYQTSASPVLTNGTQRIEVKHLRAGTLYRIQVAVETKAGQGPFSVPVQSNTSLGTTPEFYLLNNSCSACTSCLIRWILENTENTPVSAAMILYTEIKDNGKAKSWKKPIHIDEKTSEYQLKELKSNRNYFIIVRLTNKAGTSEQNITKSTNEKILCKTSKSPSVWAIFVIIIGIIVGFIVVCVLLIYIRHCNKSGLNADL